MKKFFGLLLAAVMTFSLVACGADSIGKAMDFASCRWQTDDGVPRVRRGGLTMAGRKRRAFPKRHNKGQVLPAPYCGIYLPYLLFWSSSSTTL